MPAGEIVTFKFYYVLPEGTDLETYRQATGTTAVAYTDGFKINSTKANANDARAWGAEYEAVFNPSGAVTTTSTVSTNIIKLFNDDDKAKGWTSALQVRQTYLSGGSYKALTGYPVDPECEVFSLEFVTTRTITADDSIGIPAGAYGSNYFKMNYWTSPTKTSTMYTAENAILTDNTAYPGAPALEKVNGKIRVNGSAIDLGHIGTSDMAVTVKAVYGGDGKTICRYDVDSAACGIAGVGIEAKVDGVLQSSTASKIYLNGSITDGVASETVQGGFKFLPALTGVGANALTSKIEIRTYVLKTDGSYVYSEWVELDAKTTYDNAVAAGMADIFA
jgi:hypothetical protein